MKTYIESLGNELLLHEDDKTLYVENFVKAPGRPPVLVQVWDGFKKIVLAWAGSAVIEPQQNAAPRKHHPAKL